jgi:stress response protein YsnF
MPDKNINDNRLHELRGSGYEMAEENPDIRGWKVRNLQGQIIGEVDELLFDPQSCKVRYLIVNLKGKPLNLISRKILVPIGLAELHEENDDVLLPNVNRGHLASLPGYKKGRVTKATERAVRNVFINENTVVTDDDPAAASKADDFYSHEHFDEDRMYTRRRPKLENETTIPIIEENVNIGKRTVETGGVRVRKNIAKKPVEETVNPKEEHVTIERNAVDKPARNESFAPFQESTIELTEHAEVPVVKKEARVVEEISIDKEVELRDETVRETVRKTEVDIEHLNKNDLSKENLRDDN